jgi:hypothetical protein
MPINTPRTNGAKPARLKGGGKRVRRGKAQCDTTIKTRQPNNRVGAISFSSVFCAIMAGDWKEFHQLSYVRIPLIDGDSDTKRFVVLAIHPQCKAR